MDSHEERIAALEKEVVLINTRLDGIHGSLVSTDKKLGRKNAFEFVGGVVLISVACVVGIIAVL